MFPPAGWEGYDMPSPAYLSNTCLTTHLQQWGVSYPGPGNMSTRLMPGRGKPGALTQGSQHAWVRSSIWRKEVQILALYLPGFFDQVLQAI